MTQTSPPRTTGRRTVSQSVPVWSRQRFLDYFREIYSSGHHVTLIGPTQRGKTRISHEMLQQVASPQRPAMVLSGKPPGRDHVMDEAPDKLGMIKSETWPPPMTVRARKFWQAKVAEQPKGNGYILRPHQTLDNPDDDDANMTRQFHRGLSAAYSGRMGPVIVVADETPLLYELKLHKHHERILTRGAPVVAMWSLMQRGRFITYHAYSAPEHVLFFWDPDTANVRRYAEMVGGVDPLLIRAMMESLERTESANGQTNSECIYYRRSGTQLVIVRMD